MNDKIIDLVLMICVLGLFFIFGYYTNDVFRSYQYQKQFDGLWFPNIDNKQDAIKEAQKWDSGGDWVCVNIRDASYEYNLNTCGHEVAHEMFAKECAKNFTKCEEIIR